MDTGIPLHIDVQFAQLLTQHALLMQRHRQEGVCMGGRGMVERLRIQVRSEGQIQLIYLVDLVPGRPCTSLALMRSRL